MSVAAVSPVLPVVTQPVVRAFARQVHRGRHRSRVIGIHAQPFWNGPPSFTVDGTTVYVRACVSALAVREALAEHATRPDDVLVVITDVHDLGHGITAHLAGGRLHAVQLWQAVKDAFAATKLDPLLVAEKAWAPRALVDHEPPGGWPAAPSGVLTRDHALGHLAAALLRRGPGEAPYVEAEHPDPEGLLRWSADPVALQRWLDLPEPVRAGLGGWLAGRTGKAGAWTLRAVEHGRGGDAAALGLVAWLLWHEDADPLDVGPARGQLRALLGGANVTEDDARTWGRTVTATVSAWLAGGDQAAILAVHRAEALLHELHAEQVVSLSDQLDGAFVQRLRRLADAARAALADPTPAALAPVEQAHSALLAHDLAGRDDRAHTATMAVRLLRWLATEPPTGQDDVDTLAAALDRQVRVGAWVDRAVAAVWSGDPDPHVGAAYRALAERVLERRAADDERIGVLVARATEDDADPGRIVLVEDLLARVVRPLAAERPVLLLVVDGMPASVMTEVTEGLRDRRWVELVSEPTGARQAVLPVLPTVTSASRTSLLTGRLQVGSQVTERSQFPAAVGEPARIFHKADLRTAAGEALAADVRGALLDPQVRVVAVVLNTVDDSLDKMDPGGTRWGLDAIQHLSPVLDAARQADRVVVLTADHGHVVERGSELRSAPGSGARWRPATTGPAGPGEVAVRGRRVLLGDHSVVLPWQERLRYTSIGAGYHGGVSAAEVAVPLTVHVAGVVDRLAGWVPGPPPEPVWWHSPVAGTSDVVTPPAPRRPAVDTSPTLFDDLEPPAPVGAADSAADLVSALLASDVYAAQRARSGRAAPDDERVRAVVSAVLRAGGRMHQNSVAAEARIPLARTSSVLAAIRRLLAVDGYEALSVDADGVTLVLDVPLLREQFGLGATS